MTQNSFRKPLITLKQFAGFWLGSRTIFSCQNQGSGSYILHLVINRKCSNNSVIEIINWTTTRFRRKNGLPASQHRDCFSTKWPAGHMLKMQSDAGKRESHFSAKYGGGSFIISITLLLEHLRFITRWSIYEPDPLVFWQRKYCSTSSQKASKCSSYESFRNELLRHSQNPISAVSSDLFLAKRFTVIPISQAKNDPTILSCWFSWQPIMIFIETYRMDTVAGRSFSREFSSDTAGTMMLNEAAVQRFGWTPQEAIGKERLFSEADVGKNYRYCQRLQFQVSSYMQLNQWLYYFIQIISRQFFQNSNLAILMNNRFNSTKMGTGVQESFWIQLPG